MSPASARHAASATSSAVSVASRVSRSLSGPGAVEHPRLHALRADRLDDDPAVAVGRAQPLGEGDGGVLADGVGRVAEHRQQAGGRGGDDEAPAAGVEPARHEVPGRTHVGEDVRVEGPCPLVVEASRPLSVPMPALAKKTSTCPRWPYAVSTR